MNFGLVTLITTIVIVVNMDTSRASVIPPPGHFDTLQFQPIDICIFNCDKCFKGQTLVRCANACILSEANMDDVWKKICSGIEALEKNISPHLLQSIST